MTKVWWVESGEYSDYRVHGVFSTEENAKLYTSIWGGDVVEITLDEEIELLKTGLRPWNIFMYRDGSSSPRNHITGSGLQRETSYHLAKAYTGGTGILWASGLTVQGWFDSEQHGLKVANERRVQLIASGEWKPDPEGALKHHEYKDPYLP